MRFECDYCGINFESPEDETGNSCNRCDDGTVYPVDDDYGEGDFFERDVEEENLEIARELKACGGDCPRCQQERSHDNNS